MFLDYPENGVRRRKAYLKVFKDQGIMPPELEEPEIPEIFLDTWLTFWDVYHGQELSFTELKNYFSLMEIAVSPKEVSDMMWMYSVVCSWQAEKEKPPEINVED